tara:strand:+ start:1852 stop:2160 length:309 start_codon:yes stop_codon:yes gene_type:complete
MKVEYAKRPLKPKPIMTPAYLEELESKRKTQKNVKRVKNFPCLTPAEANLLGWLRKIKDDENDEYVTNMLEKARKKIMDEGNQLNVIEKVNKIFDGLVLDSK